MPSKELAKAELIEGYSKDDYALAEQLKASSCLRNIDTGTFIRKVASRISVNKGAKLTPHHVMSVIGDALSYGIDPASTDVYAFLRGDILTFGVTIGGWAKILDARGCSWKFKTLRYGKKNGTMFPLVLECTIAKPSGQRCSWTVNYDEAVTSSPVWSQQPTQMMQVRALARCARIACGLGAVYSVDEAKAFWEQGQPQQPQAAVFGANAPATPIIEASAEPVDMTEAIALLEQAKSKDELRTAFINLPPEAKADPTVRERSKEIAATLEEETVETVEVTEEEKKNA